MKFEFTLDVVERFVLFILISVVSTLSLMTSALVVAEHGSPGDGFLDVIYIGSLVFVGGAYFALLWSPTVYFLTALRGAIERRLTA